MCYLFNQNFTTKWNHLKFNFMCFTLQMLSALVQLKSCQRYSWNWSIIDDDHRVEIYGIKLNYVSFLYRSIVALEFTFKRQKGFFLLQIYVPLTLIVCSSWVTFWLVKTEKGSEIPARTSLGATTVLSVVTIGFGGKGKPQVSLKYH